MTPAKITHLARVGGLPVPWVALWSAEEGTAFLAEEIYDGKPSLCVSHLEALGEGTARLGMMSQLRQRRAMRLGLCQVCGKPMTRRYVALSTSGERIKLGRSGSFPLLIEPPACATCASIALAHCPGVRGRTFVELLDLILVQQIVRPLGDPAQDSMFLPLTPADFPSSGAVGYIKYAVTKHRPSDLTPLVLRGDR
jgi:hypothetical protein